jgi:uncharacterized damage-inducible protein DinB
MFQTLDGFLKTWNYEAGATQRLLNNLTDESLKQEVTPDNWTLGRIAWHITTAIRNMTSATGLEFNGPSQDYPVPSSASSIAQSYTDANEAFVKAVQTQWRDDNLNQITDFFGRQMPNGLLFFILVQHQIHHRGQMTVLMRQAGLRVPGVYGPSKEEWVAQGMEPPRQ